MVERVINSHCYRYKKMQGDELPSFMKNRGFLYQVLADASGDLSERPWNKLSMIDDRIVSSGSSAVIQELITRDAFADRTTVWDPFCHNGSLLLELLSYLNDEKFRAESPNYPLHNCANDLLAKLKDQNAVQQTETKETTRNIEIKFDCKLITDVPLDLNKCVILTNLYYGNKEMKAQYSNYFREFLKFIKSKSPQTPSVYVISPRSFKRVSKLKWETLMVFNNNGIIVDFLKLLK
uniref:DNA methylase adenine-specific domain-containing protein n=1 Tax=Theileria annulata TaxID=5874 RepID=A0A3B0NCA4_THEAN